ncbi:hypothetical protein K443DRAFT_114658 [Laccaria amethystina LaAM-08-1]|uniref:Cyclin N-terminal domain-containing protein n=1 Tax=Laccaria amethystina LaAM-08-1 TaxID=1095629 RepID=A0A0C9X263_9AGAR|nr:hypothetical protein K443DRAFT_114658 [Laccaria amethystina LaAM-08-1]
MVSKVVRARPAPASGIAKHVRGASVSTTASSKTGTEEGSVAEKVVLKRAATKGVPSTSSFAAKAETKTRTTAAVKGKTLLKHEIDDVEEGHRVFKRRHVDIPEEPIQQDESQIEADRIAAELIEADAKVVPEFKEEPVELWDDLDAGDWDDPFMVSEYVVEVCKYWKKLEVETLPQGDYMNRQAEITWEHRGILVDWILQVHARFNMLQESFLLSVNVLDRFLSKRQISIGRLQLVGLASFLIATKFEETYAPSVAEMVTLADKQYTADDILKAERYILKTLNWDLRSPGPMNWLRRGSKADHSETKARTIAKYLIEIGCLEWRLVAVVPSLISAAALWLARLTLGREEWTPNLAHYTTYSEEEILPTAKIMLEYILTNPIQHESLYKKFSSRRYFRVRRPLFLFVAILTLVVCRLAPGCWRGH